MDNQTLHDKFRQQLTNVHALTVSTVSLFEIIGYIILVLAGVEYFSIENHYLWYGVIIPIVLNVATHLIARMIVHNPRVSREKKNACIIIAALITSFIVAIIHKEYIVTSCAFIFPMILSATFNSRKLLHTTFIASVFILMSVGLAFWLDKAATLHSSISLFILFGFSFISYLCGIISINFSKQNYTTIESQAAQNSKLRQDASSDLMTGLYNHHSFVTHLDEYIESFNGEGKLCLAIVDIDNFKHVNDTYGHDCGDTVLIHLARVLKAHCTENSTAYRYGGEEFAILLEDQTQDEAASVVQAILDEFKTHTFPFTDKTITFSAGIAELSVGDNRELLFKRADEMLYMAKREGKDRVFKAP